MQDALTDFRFALRLLRRRPGFAAIAVLSLALGIGANTVIFSLIHQLFLTPLPIEEPQRVVAIRTLDARSGGVGQGGNSPLSHLNWRDIRDQNEVFDAVGSYAFSGAAFAPAGRDPEIVPTLVVSGNYFQALGVTPAAGRWFRPEEGDRPGAGPVVVLHHDTWVEQLGADAGALGSTVRINGTPMTVVGIAPPGFDGLNIGFKPALWIPESMNAVTHPDAELNWFDERRGLFLFGFGRLTDGVELEQANANLALLGSRLEQEYPDDNEGRSFGAQPIADTALFNRGGVSASSTLLMSTVGLILLIACVNVANLLLGRALERRREIAVRLAAGVARFRLVRQLLTESLVVSLLGGALGLALAWLSRARLADLFSNYPGLAQLQLDVSLDPAVLGFTVALTLITGLLFGLVPALQASKPELVAALKDSGEGLPRAGRRFDARSGLVIAQLALSMIALAGAGLFVRSFAAAQQLDLGFSTERLLAVGFNVGITGRSPEQGQQFYRQVREQVAALPGVESVALSQARPLQGTFLRSVVLPEATDQQKTFVQVASVGPNYFDTLGIPMVAGRAINDTDREGSVPVVVVNEAMAQRYWPGENAVGKRFNFFSLDPVEVIGVAKTVDYNTPGEDPQPYAYMPLEQMYTVTVNVLVRTVGDPDTVLLATQDVIRKADADLALLAPATVDQVVRNALAGQRFTAVFLSLFGGIALVLAAIGIYGVMAYSVRQRRRELGIRMALGARSEGILAMVLRQGTRLAAFGLVIGALAAVLILRRASQMLFIDTSDPLTLIVTGAILMAVAVVACLVPALRASRVDPIVVLRNE